MVPACSEIEGDPPPIQTKNLTDGLMSDTALAAWVAADNETWTLTEWAQQHGQGLFIQYLEAGRGSDLVRFVKAGGSDHRQPVLRVPRENRGGADYGSADGAACLRNGSRYRVRRSLHRTVQQHVDCSEREPQLPEHRRRRGGAVPAGDDTEQQSRGRRNSPCRTANTTRVSARSPTASSCGVGSEPCCRASNRCGDASSFCALPTRGIEASAGTRQAQVAADLTAIALP